MNSVTSILENLGFDIYSPYSADGPLEHLSPPVHIRVALEIVTVAMERTGYDPHFEHFGEDFLHDPVPSEIDRASDTLAPRPIYNRQDWGSDVFDAGAMDAEIAELLHGDQERWHCSICDGAGFIYTSGPGKHADEIPCICTLVDAGPDAGSDRLNEHLQRLEDCRDHVQDDIDEDVINSL